MTKHKIIQNKDIVLIISEISNKHKDYYISSITKTNNIECFRFDELKEDQIKSIVGKLIYNDEGSGDQNVFKDYLNNHSTYKSIDFLMSLFEVNNIYFNDDLTTEEISENLWNKNLTYIFIKHI